MVPKYVFFTKGVGRHREELASFEAALRMAGIEKCNLVNVSSILPPGSRIISHDRGLTQLKAGQITFVVMARIQSNEPNRLIAASIGMAVPQNPNEQYGYLSEHHSFGETEQRCGEYAEDLAASMLASTLGVEFNLEQAWSEREQVYKASGKIIKTQNYTQSAQVDKGGLWTCVISAAVFLFE